MSKMSHKAVERVKATIEQENKEPLTVYPRRPILQGQAGYVKSVAAFFDAQQLIKLRRGDFESPTAPSSDTLSPKASQ
jgi:hypothetical protein